MTAKHSLYKNRKKFKEASPEQKINSSYQIKLNIIEKEYHKLEDIIKRYKLRLKLIGLFFNILEERHPEIYKEIRLQYKIRVKEKYPEFSRRNKESTMEKKK